MYINEDNKTFWQLADGSMIRCHDDNFNGMKFTYKRCPFCKKITSKHSLHWFNHLNKCAPAEYSKYDLLQLRYKNIEQLTGLRIGR